MRRIVVLVYANARATAPVAAVSLIVHLDYRFASCGNDVARVKHHACDGVVVGIGVEDRTGPEIPDLRRVSDYDYD
jgi:hypothetical protein